MPIKTKRWNDLAEPSDGFRLLISRYQPRGVRKEDETWDAWWPQLGPSRALHADYYGKHGPPISFLEYTTRYLTEMEQERDLIAKLAAHVARGEALTLLCSSACVDATRCHRTLLRGIIEREPPKSR